MIENETADIPPFRYTATMAGEIEAHWQDYWQEQGTFRAPNPTGSLADPEHPRSGAPKFYLLDMFPYPSGAGLHIGHPLGYIGTDCLGRFHRMAGHNVLHAMGFDAFGLPAEQYAVQTGQHPRKTTEENIDRYRMQLRRLGLAHDDRRSVVTSDVEFYRWTQWIFVQIFNSWYDRDAKRARPIDELIKLYEKGKRKTPDGRPWKRLTEVERRAIIDDHRLTYVSDAPVNWCPGLGTVLADAEVTADGRSERGNFPVFKRRMKQWLMRITEYGDRLLADLDGLDWPDRVKTMQRNWIGRSTGAYIDFPVSGRGSGSRPLAQAARAQTAGEMIRVFTTRPDTIFGATYMVTAPEHEIVDRLIPDAWPEGTKDSWTGGHPTPGEAVAAYRKFAAAETEIERLSARRPETGSGAGANDPDSAAKEKTGVFVGAFATNPSNGQRIPVFVADYVLPGYGTGAIMAVPGQDERDWAFAETFDLPIIRTVQPPADFDGKAYPGEGPAINSGFLDGMGVTDAKAAITEWLVAHGHGEAAVTYRLRDWLFSRQRYWGEPFPIVYDETGLPVALPESMLPLELPEIADFSPKTYHPDDAQSEPETPLSRATEWVNVTLDLGGGPEPYQRETNTMPQWAGSCWYELRYLDPFNDKAFVDPSNEEYWMGPQDASDCGGVDMYVGGVEHAVLHLLYARFWHKVLYDLGHVSSYEPYRRLYNQGYIQAYAYTDERGVYVDAEHVAEVTAGRHEFEGRPVTREYGKMGKSLRNVVTPDEMCANYGADTFRVYEMSMGPMDVSRPWETRAVIGSYRFLQRVWRAIVDEHTGESRVVDADLDDQTRRLLHAVIAQVTEDMPEMRFNTAVAKLIELTNRVTAIGGEGTSREVAEPLIKMIAPFAPHLAEEAWKRIGNDTSIAYEPFPVADPALLVAATVTYPVQINGKVRGRIEVPADAVPAAVEAAALAAVADQTEGRAPKKVIVVPGRMVSIVV